MRRSVIAGAAVFVVAFTCFIYLRMPVPPPHGQDGPRATGIVHPVPQPAEPDAFRQAVLRGQTLESTPASLSGTEVDGELAVDADGRLFITPGLRRLFDYFLTTLGEEDLVIIRARIAAHLAATLPDPAAQEAWQLLEQYLGYREALADLPPHPRTALGAREAMKMRHGLRNQWFGEHIAEAFFGFEDRLDRYTLARLEVIEDESLSADEKAYRISLLRAELPREVQAMMERRTAPARVAEEVEALRESGATEAEVRALREARFGVEAADRLEALDRERSDWQARVMDYNDRRETILSSGLSLQDQQREIEALRNKLFDEVERRRILALERIAAGSDAAGS